MTTEALAANSLPLELSDAWRDDVQMQLRPQENVLAALQVDLNTQLQFVNGLVLVSNQRLMSRMDGQARWESWAYRQGMVLQHYDHDNSSNCRKAKFSLIP